jgi:hypothetical protein
MVKHVSAEEAMWKLLARHGGVYGKQEYYGSNIKFDKYATFRDLRFMRKNLAGMLPLIGSPNTDIDYRFNGTFTNNELRVHYLKGTFRFGKAEKPSREITLVYETDVTEFSHVLGAVLAIASSDWYELLTDNLADKTALHPYYWER